MKSFINKIAIDEYDSLPALRSTMIKELLKSPAHYMWRLQHPEEDADNSNFRIGRLVHALILEPDDVRNQFVMVDTSTRTTKEFKQTVESLEKSGDKRTVMLTREVEPCERMRDAALSDPAVRALIEAGYAEISAAAQINDIWVKARADSWLSDIGMIVDIKTTSDSAHYFPANCRKYDYHTSAALYLDTFNAAGAEISVEHFKFIVIEKNPPYAVKIFTASEAFIKEGRRRYQMALEIFRRARDMDDWKAYDNTVDTILEI